MARPAYLPEAIPVGTNLSLEVVAALDQAMRERGIAKRTIFEIALRRELGLSDYPHPGIGQTVPAVTDTSEELRTAS